MTIRGTNGLQESLSLLNDLYQAQEPKAKSKSKSIPKRFIQSFVRDFVKANQDLGRAISDINLFERLVAKYQDHKIAKKNKKISQTQDQAQIAENDKKINQFIKTQDDLVSLDQKELTQKEIDVVTFLLEKCSLTPNYYHWNALKAYIAEQDSNLTANEIGKKFLKEIFENEGVETFLAQQNMDQTLPNLKKFDEAYIQYGTQKGNYLHDLMHQFPTYMKAYNYDVSFQMLQKIEATFSAKELEHLKACMQGKKMQVTEQRRFIGLLFKYPEQPELAKQYLARFSH